MFGFSIETSLSIFFIAFVISAVAIYQKLSDIDKRLYYIFKITDSIARRQAGLDDDLD